MTSTKSNKLVTIKYGDYEYEWFKGDLESLSRICKLFELKKRLEVLNEVRDRARQLLGTNKHFSNEDWYRAINDAWYNMRAETELAIGIEERSGNNEP